MPGRNLVYILGKCSLLVIETSNDLKGCQSTVTIRTEKKRLILIITYRIPETCGDGVFTVKAQLDKCHKSVKTTSFHKETMMKDLTELIETLKRIDEIISAGDFNEDIDSRNTQQFLIRNRLMEVHTFVNGPYQNK